MSSSYDFQEHLQYSQRCRFSPTALQRLKVLPGLSLMLLGAPRHVVGAPRLVASAPRYSQTYNNHCHGTAQPVIRDPSYSEGLPECPPMVWQSSEIDASKFTLHILSDTPGGSQWVNYILLMFHADGHGRCWVLHVLDLKLDCRKSVSIHPSFVALRYCVPGIHQECIHVCNARWG